MKSVIKVLLTMVFVIFLAGCSQDTSQSGSDTQSWQEQYEQEAADELSEETQEEYADTAENDADIQNEESADSTAEAQEEGDYNAYGAVSFTKRERYQEFEEYSEEKQAFIRDMAEAVESGDTDRAIELVRNTDLRMYGLTMLNGYKIAIYRNAGEYLIGGNCIYTYVYMRSENGMGYCLAIMDADIAYDSEEQEGIHVSYITCPCENWQWNGEFTETDLSEGMASWSTSSSTRTDNYTDTRTISGTVVENFRDGEFYITEHTVVTSTSAANNKDETADYVDVYEDGVLVEQGTGLSSSALFVFDQISSAVQGGVDYTGTIFWISESTGYYDKESLLASYWLETLYW